VQNLFVVDLLHMSTLILKYGMHPMFDGFSKFTEQTSSIMCNTAKLQANLYHRCVASNSIQLTIKAAASGHWTKPICKC